MLKNRKVPNKSRFGFRNWDVRFAFVSDFDIRISDFYSLIGKRIFAITLATLILLSVYQAEAQQPTKVPRIGYLTNASLSASAARTEAFRQGLRELGYVEGKNILIASRAAEEV